MKIIWPEILGSHIHDCGLFYWDMKDWKTRIFNKNTWLYEENKLMSNFSNDAYQTLVADLIGDTFYKDISVSGRISFIRKYANN